MSYRRFPQRRRGSGRHLVLVLLAIAVLAGIRHFSTLDDARRATGPARTGELSGYARVIDGDSLALGDHRLRLVGIDAPELAQTCRRGDASYPCGIEARDHLVALVGGRVVRCRWDRLDKYGRSLAACRAGDVDLGSRMVADGWAVSYGGHEPEEAAAQGARRGLWAGRFEAPEDFRRDRRAGRIPEEERPWWRIW